MNMKRAIHHKYRIVAQLGEGTMGCVYRVFNQRLSRFEALKVLHSKHAQRADFVALFQREALAMGQLHHENIVQVFDVFEWQGQHCISMELVEALSLQQCLQGKRDFSLQQYLEIFTQIARGLHHAHQHGVLHKDIKPANILIDAQQQVKIADFGVAHVRNHEHSLIDHHIMGSPLYMSPEQARGDDLDERSDLYALGMLMYRMLSGAAFDARSVQHAAMRQRCETRPNLQFEHPIPKAMRSLIHDLLALEPDLRPRHAVDVCMQLQQCRAASLRDASASETARLPRCVRNISLTTTAAALGLFTLSGLLLRPSTDWVPESTFSGLERGVEPVTPITTTRQADLAGVDLSKVDAARLVNPLRLVGAVKAGAQPHSGGSGLRSARHEQETRAHTSGDSSEVLLIEQKTPHTRNTTRNEHRQNGGQSEFAGARMVRGLNPNRGDSLAPSHSKPATKMLPLSVLPVAPHALSNTIETHARRLTSRSETLLPAHLGSNGAPDNKPLEYAPRRIAETPRTTSQPTPQPSEQQRVIITDQATQQVRDMPVTAVALMSPPVSTSKIVTQLGSIEVALSQRGDVQGKAKSHAESQSKSNALHAQSRALQVASGSEVSATLASENRAADYEEEEDY